MGRSTSTEVLVNEQPLLLPRPRDEDELALVLEKLIDQGIVQRFRDHKGAVIYVQLKSSREVN